MVLKDLFYKDISADAVDISSLKVLDNYIDSSGIRYLGVPVYDVSYSTVDLSYSTAWTGNSNLIRQTKLSPNGLIRVDLKGNNYLHILFSG